MSTKNCLNSKKALFYRLITENDTDTHTIPGYSFSTYHTLYELMISAKKASPASDFADEYLAGASGHGYEGWGFGLHIVRTPQSDEFRVSGGKQYFCCRDVFDATNE